MKSLRDILLCSILLLVGASGVLAQTVGKNTANVTSTGEIPTHAMEPRFELWRQQMGSTARVEELIDSYKRRYQMLDVRKTASRATTSSAAAAKSFGDAADFEDMVPYPGQTEDTRLMMPSVITAQNGDILSVVRIDGVPDESDFFGPPIESPTMIFRRSTDGGLTWSDPVTIRSDGETITAFYFPQLVEAAGGRLAVFDRHPFGTATMSYSDDGGATWQDGSRSENPGDSYHPPIDGKLWHTYADVNNERFVFVTSDNADTWSAPKTIKPFQNGFGLDLTSVAQSGSTIVALFFRFNDNGQDMATVTSTDGGATWGPFVPVPFEAPVESGAKGSGLGPSPFDAKMKTDATGNLEIIAVADEFPAQMADIYRLTSSDAGVNWSSPSQFTLFTGPDYLGDVAFSSAGSLIFFGSDRYSASGGVYYGLFGTTTDVNAPPFVDFSFDFGGYPDWSPPNTPRSLVYAVSGVSAIDNVNLVLEYGSMTDISPLLDNGVAPDQTAGDGLFSGTLPGLDFGPSATYRAEATDVNGRGASSFEATLEILPVTTAGDLVVAINRDGQFGLSNTYSFPITGAGQWPGGNAFNYVSLGGFFVAVDGNPARVMHTYWDNWGGGDWTYDDDNFPVADDRVSDSDFIVEFNDSAAPDPIGLNVRNGIYQWSTGDETNAVVLEYEIANASGGDLEGVVASLFLDPDIYLEFGGTFDDKVGWDADNGILYMFDSKQDCNNPDLNPDPGMYPCVDTHVGMVLLADGAAGKRAAIIPQTVAKWIDEQDPRRFNGNDDGSFHDLMTSGIDAALGLGLTPPPNDYRILISPEAFDIAAGATATVVFALVMGNSPAELAVNAAAIAAAYAAAPVAAEDAGFGEQPGEFALGQNYPNPFNPSTVIPFTIGETGQVMLTVSDVLGRTVAILVNESVPAGTHTASFEATDLPSGTYFYTLSAGGNVQSKTLFLLK